MPSEEELRKHRCCFTGHRPEKLRENEEDVKDWLEEKIREAIDDGYVTFITGMAMGVDLWAAQIVIRLKEENPALHLICATPWSGLGNPYEMINRFGNKEKRSGLSAKSIKNLHGVLHKAFQQAVLCQYIRVNPCDACKLPRVEKKEMKILQGEDVSTFLKAIKGDLYEAIYFIDLCTGLRQGEILGLTWDCVDLNKGIIRVEKQLRKDHTGGSEYCFTSLKNGKTRTVTPAPMVLDTLRKVRAEQSKWKLQAGEAYNNDMNLVFTNELGQHLSSVTVYNHLKRILEKVGLGAIRFHDLRHSFATLSLQNGDDIKTVSENLGHATVAFTLDVYGHVTDKMRKDSADRMQAFLESL